MAAEEISNNNYLENLRNINYDLDQDLFTGESINFSLKYLASLKNAITLWHHILERINSATIITIASSRSKRKRFKMKIIEKNFKLEIPENCKMLLKSMINLTGDELFNFIDIQISRFAELNELKMCLSNIIWTQHGTINTSKTIKKLIDNTNLSIYVKFKLACNYCLEEKILDLVDLCSEHYTNPLNFNDTKEKFPMVMFWIFRIKGRQDQFDLTYEDLLNFTVRNRMEIAVKYIMENIVDELDKEWAIHLAYSAFSPPSDTKQWTASISRLGFYLFTQMSQDQFKEHAGVNMHLCILSKAYKSLRWCHFISIPKCVLYIIRYLEFKDSFSVILACCEMDLINMNQFLNIWTEFKTKYNLHIKNDFMGICENYFLPYTYTEKSMIFGIYLLKMGTPVEIKSIIYSYDIMCWFSHMIIVDPDLMSDTLGKIGLIEEISTFKKKLLKYHILDICEAAISSYNFKNLNRILKEFGGEGKRSKYKETIPYKESFSIFNRIFSFIEQDHDVDILKSFNKFLEWCFNGNHSKIIKYKSIVFNLETDLHGNIKDNFFIHIRELIQKRNWKVAKKHFLWVFGATRDKITTSNEKLGRFKMVIDFVYEDKYITSYMRFILSSRLKRPVTFLKIDESEKQKESIFSIFNTSFKLYQIMNKRKLVDFLYYSCFRC